MKTHCVWALGPSLFMRAAILSPPESGVNASEETPSEGEGGGGLAFWSRPDGRAKKELEFREKGKILMKQ